MKSYRDNDYIYHRAHVKLCTICTLSGAGYKVENISLLRAYANLSITKTLNWLF